MTNVYKIPNTIVSYKEGFEPDTHPTAEQSLVYEPTEGELIHVVSWVRYPSYDFIFGIPDPKNPKYEKEIGFFQYRDTRAKRVLIGVYLDVQEIIEFIEGFVLLRNNSQLNSPKLWQEFLNKTK